MRVSSDYGNMEATSDSLCLNTNPTGARLRDDDAVFGRPSSFLRLETGSSDDSDQDTQLLIISIARRRILRHDESRMTIEVMNMDGCALPPP